MKHENGLTALPDVPLPVDHIDAVDWMRRGSVVHKAGAGRNAFAYKSGVRRNEAAEQYCRRLERDLRRLRLPVAVRIEAQGFSLRHLDHGFDMPMICWDALAHVVQNVSDSRGEPVDWLGPLIPDTWVLL